MSFDDKQRGFSLIELMVSLAILGILLGSGVAMFSQFQDRREAEAVARELRQFMVQARSKARSQASAGCITGQKLVRYRVEIHDGASYAEMKPICADLSESRFEGNEGSEDSWERYQFSTPAMMDKFSEWVEFYSQLGGATMADDIGNSDSDPNREQEFVVMKGDYKYGFVVHGSGEIGSVRDK